MYIRFISQTLNDKTFFTYQKLLSNAFVPPSVRMGYSTSSVGTHTWILRLDIKL